MMAPTPLDLELAAEGYLRCPDGRIRHVLGLDRLARDTLTAGVRVSWCDLPGSCPGLCLCRSRHICLAPWLFWAFPFFVRRVWVHELGHALLGPSELRVQPWQMQRYGDLITWPEWV